MPFAAADTEYGIELLRFLKIFVKSGRKLVEQKHLR